MAIAAPALDAVARFRADTAALIGDAPARLGIAVSGGPDSLALLLLAHAAWPGQVAAATVDHRLRPESAAEAAFVADICRTLDVPHATLAADAPIAGNVQAGARALRYRLLGQWAAQAGVDWILTAHHADDQAETVLMRLLRGAGVGGLGGVRAATRIGGHAVARPLLGWTRAELAAIAGASLTPIQDPGNMDDRYDRTRLRGHLADARWIDPLALARSAAALADADAALEWATDRLYAERVRIDGAALVLTPHDIPAELRRRLVLRVLAALSPEAAPRGPALQRLIAKLGEGATTTLAGVHCRGGAVWRFTVAPPRRG